MVNPFDSLLNGQCFDSLLNVLWLNSSLNIQIQWLTMPEGHLSILAWWKSPWLNALDVSARGGTPPRLLALGPSALGGTDPWLLAVDVSALGGTPPRLLALGSSALGGTAHWLLAVDASVLACTQ